MKRLRRVLKGFVAGWLAALGVRVWDEATDIEVLRAKAQMFTSYAGWKRMSERVETGIERHWREEEEAKFAGGAAGVGCNS